MLMIVDYTEGFSAPGSCIVFRHDACLAAVHWSINMYYPATSKEAVLVGQKWYNFPSRVVVLGTWLWLRYQTPLGNHGCEGTELYCGSCMRACRSLAVYHQDFELRQQCHSQWEQANAFLAGSLLEWGKNGRSCIWRKNLTPHWTILRFVAPQSQAVNNMTWETYSSHKDLIWEHAAVSPRKCWKMKVTS